MEQQQPECACEVRKDIIAKAVEVSQARHYIENGGMLTKLVWGQHSLAPVPHLPPLTAPISVQRCCQLLDDVLGPNYVPGLLPPPQGLVPTALSLEDKLPLRPWSRSLEGVSIFSGLAWGGVGLGLRAVGCSWAGL